MEQCKGEGAGGRWDYLAGCGLRGVPGGHRGPSESVSKKRIQSSPRRKPGSRQTVETLDSRQEHAGMTTTGFPVVLWLQTFAPLRLCVRNDTILAMTRNLPWERLPRSTLPKLSIDLP
jgi:hypothetical protein